MKIKDFKYYDILQKHSLWCTNNNKILKTVDSNNYSVVRLLSLFSKTTNWLSEDKILMLLNSKFKGCFILLLAYGHPHWITTNLRILNLKDFNSKTIKTALIEQGKIK